MSAYGKISQPTRSPTLTLLPRSYPLRAQPGSATVPTCTVFPLSRSTVDGKLLSYLAGVFNGVVREGRTYPQMDELSEDAFGDYFFGQDCFVALLDASPRVASAGVESDGGTDLPDAAVEQVRTGRDWEECVLGMYYIKNCNGGFVVPPSHRGLGVGVTLGRSYLHFAPLLGYKGSVFNLVYISNAASVRIWDQLGFTRAGLIPKAGRLKSKTEGGEDEYVDAIVYYYSFH